MLPQLESGRPLLPARRGSGTFQDWILSACRRVSRRPLQKRVLQVPQGLLEGSVGVGCWTPQASFRISISHPISWILPRDLSPPSVATAWTLLSLWPPGLFAKMTKVYSFRGNLFFSRSFEPCPPFLVLALFCWLLDVKQVEQQK